MGLLARCRASSRCSSRLLAFGAFSGLEQFDGKAFGWRLVLLSRSPRSSARSARGSPAAPRGLPVRARHPAGLAVPASDVVGNVARSLRLAPGRRPQATLVNWALLGARGRSARRPIGLPRSGASSIVVGSARRPRSSGARRVRRLHPQLGGAATRRTPTRLGDMLPRAHRVDRRGARDRRRLRDGQRSRADSARTRRASALGGELELAAELDRAAGTSRPPRRAGTPRCRRRRARGTSRRRG